MNDKNDPPIPEQKVGAQMDVVERISLESEVAAIASFSLVKQRLLAINKWGIYAGQALSSFQLTNAFGNAVDRQPQIGDYIKIDIPGPGTSLGKGYDWVRIEEIIEEAEVGMERLSLRVRPANNPLSNNPETAHFLTQHASSTFQVKRIGRDISAEEHGRNELPNTETAQNLDNLRNTVVGWAATLGFSYPQWKALVKGLLHFDDKPKT